MGYKIFILRKRYESDSQDQLSITPLSEELAEVAAKYNMKVKEVNEEQAELVCTQDNQIQI